jgi:mannose/fructose/N-acetylgalactosamine-specific phosphotransferase system component IIC
VPLFYPLVLVRGIVILGIILALLYYAWRNKGNKLQAQLVEAVPAGVKASSA